MVDAFTELDMDTPSRVVVSYAKGKRKRSVETYGMTFRELEPLVEQLKEMYPSWELEETSVHKDRGWKFSKKNH